MAWLWGFAHSASADLPWQVFASLAGVVWLIYTWDRLQDGRESPADQPKTERHAFHVEHSRALNRTLFPVAVLVAVLALSVLELERWIAALPPAGAAVVYLLVLRKSRIIPKELACGAIFALGVTAYVAIDFEARHWGWTVWFAGLCSLNCLCIARWEARIDQSQDPASAGACRESWVRGLPLATALLGVCPWIWPGPAPLTVALSASALLLSGLLRVEQRISLRARRVLVDVVLCTPLCIGWF